jgi:hypothetical protein
MTLIDKHLKDVQTIVNARHYKQYILPLVEAVEESHKKVEIIKIQKSIVNIIASTINQLAPRSVEIDGKTYVELDVMTEILQKELQIYT